MSRADRNTEADLAALADGSLPARRREALLRRVESSPELAAGLARQREALALMRSLDGVEAPESLYASVQAEARAPHARPARGPMAGATRRRIGAAGALAGAAAALVLVLVLAGGAGPASPSVREAARIALARATRGAPVPYVHDRRLLADALEGVRFPFWQRALAWRAVGSRADRMGGRTVRVVYYEPMRGGGAGSQRIGYAIVSGPALSAPGGEPLAWRGVHFDALELDGSPVLTWRREGHTCVLAGRGVTVTTLMHMAARA